MEAHVALELTKEEKLQRGFIVGCIVADDDSTMKVLVRHSYTAYQANNPRYKWPSLHHKKSGILGAKCSMCKDTIRNQTRFSLQEEESQDSLNTLREKGK
eukprot:6499791-Ditylum_brightwellii.AAC.1